MKNLYLVFPVCVVALLSACDGNSKHKPPKLNAPPTAINASASTQADTPVAGKLMGSDMEKDALEFAVSAQPAQGMLTLQRDGSFTYSPNADVTGMDQFTFTVSDGKSTSTTATVNITIDLLAVNMGAYTRNAYNQKDSDTPLSLNSRTVTQDVIDETGFDDLLTQ